MAASTKLFTSCSLLMAATFAYSASVQLNDPDWYFWFPLYVAASFVNATMMNSESKARRRVAGLTVWGGQLLMWKVVAEDVVNGTAGVWSLDLSERVVREKVGSGMVVVSMALHCLKMGNNGVGRKGVVEYGMLGLVIFSFGLPFVFFVVRGGELKFD